MAQRRSKKLFEQSKKLLDNKKVEQYERMKDDLNPSRTHRNYIKQRLREHYHAKLTHPSYQHFLPFEGPELENRRGTPPPENQR